MRLAQIAVGVAMVLVTVLFAWLITGFDMDGTAQRFSDRINGRPPATAAR